MAINAGLLPLFFAAPGIASAQLSISEIMYNPDGSDGGREWVEIYNAGSSDVTMVGGTAKGSWRVSDGSKHAMIDPAGGVGRGSLTVPAGGYIVISNDPEAFLAEYPAGSYSVIRSAISLNNTGATIVLIDGEGNAVDSVSYTSDEGANGDGTSLQKLPGGTWSAATPTPGAGTSSGTSTQPADTGAASSSETAVAPAAPASGGTVSSYVPPPLPQIFANAGGDRNVIVGADAEFDGRAYDRARESLDPSKTRFSWTFGDGSTAEGAAVLHHFDYPGRYAVVLTIAEHTDSAADTITVTAEPAALDTSIEQDGSFLITNRSQHDLDLSRWIVGAGDGPLAVQFMLPVHSIVLAGAAIRIAPSLLGFHAGFGTRLEYPNGVSVALDTAAVPIAAASPATTTIVSSATRTPSQDAAVAAVPRPKARAFFDRGVRSIDSPIGADSEPALATTAAQTAAIGAPGSSGSWWWLAALALSGVGAGALIVSRKSAKKEWNIVEEKQE